MLPFSQNATLSFDGVTTASHRSKMLEVQYRPISIGPFKPRTFNLIAHAATSFRSPVISASNAFGSSLIFFRVLTCPFIMASSTLTSCANPRETPYWLDQPSGNCRSGRRCGSAIHCLAL